MSTRRRVGLGLLAWALVVAGVSGVAWLAIDRAGRQVLEPTSLPGTGAAAGPTTDRSDGASAPGSPRPRSSDTATPGPSPSRSPSATPSGSTSTTGQAPARRTRTVSVAGGRFAVTCDGRRVALLYATPQDGWRVEVDDDGPEKVEVHFEQRSGGEGESEHSARCVGGSPRVQTEEHGESGEG